MPTLAIMVTGLSAPQPADRILVDFTIIVEGDFTSRTGDVYVPFATSADAINVAIRNAAIAVAAAHGHVIGDGVQRLFGGALANIS